MKVTNPQLASEPQAEVRRRTVLPQINFTEVSSLTVFPDSKLGQSDVKSSSRLRAISKRFRYDSVTRDSTGLETLIYPSI